MDITSKDEDSGQAKAKLPTMTMKHITDASILVKKSKFCRKTPLLSNMQHILSESIQAATPSSFSLKLENMQSTGSFKIRGVVSQFANLPGDVLSGQKQLVTMSAGNYGKAFAFLVAQLSLKGLVLMPLTAPQNRINVIKKYNGLQTESHAVQELQQKVDDYVAHRDMHFCHPFDDFYLIAGYCSVALEIVEECPQVEVVVVGCGGGGLLAGISSAMFHLRGDACKVYAVEPEGAPAMYESMKCGHPVILKSTNSIATGLCAPYTGQLAFELCRKNLADVILVSDEEIKSGMAKLFRNGIVAEPAGCAGVAALLSGRIPGIDGKNVVSIITGGNVTPSEFSQYNIQ